MAPAQDILCCWADRLGLSVALAGTNALWPSRVDGCIAHCIFAQLQGEALPNGSSRFVNFRRDFESEKSGTAHGSGNCTCRAAVRINRILARSNHFSATVQNKRITSVLSATHPVSFRLSTANTVILIAVNKSLRVVFIRTIIVDAHRNIEDGVSGACLRPYSRANHVL